LPPWAPWWIGASGGLFATILGKQVFGGLGCNLFNPAMIARVALLISFPVHMTQMVEPLPLGSTGAPDFVAGLRLIFFGGPEFDAVSSATLLSHTKAEFSRGLDLIQQGVSLPSVLGIQAGSLGETSALLIALGGVVLLGWRVISWPIPLAMLTGLAVPALIAHALDPARYLDAATHLLSGAAVLGAFFIATDSVTSPNTRPGQLVFGLGCGLLTWIIRTYGSYPEGVAFAVLLMNATTPLIDRWIRPRIYGRDRRGRALEPSHPDSKGDQR